MNLCIIHKYYYKRSRFSKAIRGIIPLHKMKKMIKKTCFEMYDANLYEINSYTYNNHSKKILSFVIDSTFGIPKTLSYTINTVETYYNLLKEIFPEKIIRDL